MSVASDWKSVNPKRAKRARFSWVNERKGKKVEKGASEASEGNMYHRYIKPSFNAIITLGIVRILQRFGFVSTLTDFLPFH